MGLIKDSAGIFKALVLEGSTFQNARENWIAGPKGV